MITSPKKYAARGPCSDCQSGATEGGARWRRRRRCREEAACRQQRADGRAADRGRGSSRRVPGGPGEAAAEAPSPATAGFSAPRGGGLNSCRVAPPPEAYQVRQADLEAEPP